MSDVVVAMRFSVGLSRSLACTHSLVGKEQFTHCSIKQHVDHRSPPPHLGPGGGRTVTCSDLRSISNMRVVRKPTKTAIQRSGILLKSQVASYRAAEVSPSSIMFLS